MTEKYRLVTRSDFDGLVCAALFQEMGMIDEIKFVHPKDMQDGLVAITQRDITTNLPYVEGCYQAFDHHHSETVRVGPNANHIIDPEAPSAARVVYNHFGGRSRFPRIPVSLMAAVDKGDAARFSLDDVLDPKGWDLMNFLMDARTGLGRFRNFRISNYDLMMTLIELCRSLPIEEILELPDVKERVELYNEQAVKFRDQIRRCTTVHGPLVVLDLRDEETIFAGNRFMIYAIYPQTNISMHVLWGREKQNTVFAIGKSIFNKTSPINVGELCLDYGGGGHEAAGTCQVPNEVAASRLQEIIGRITAA
jgi:nanoRNase/pAp phosphatase (c-di-AMP/oligoRNAs hydrolase)